MATLDMWALNKATNLSPDIWSAYSVLQALLVSDFHPARNSPSTHLV
jgi:hypothetical protein